MLSFRSHTFTDKPWISFLISILFSSFLDPTSKNVNGRKRGHDSTWNNDDDVDDDTMYKVAHCDPAKGARTSLISYRYSLLVVLIFSYFVH